MTLKIVNSTSTHLSMIPARPLTRPAFVSDVLPSAAVEKTGTMLSDGAIYSSIDFMGKAGYSSPARGTQPTPYATTQILQSNSFHELAVDRPDPRWKASLQAQQEMANLGYSLTERHPGSGTRKTEPVVFFLLFLCDAALLCMCLGSQRTAALLERPVKAIFYFVIK